MTISVPMILRRRIIKRLKQSGAVSKESAKTLAEMDMEKVPFSLPGAKRILSILIGRGVIQTIEDRYYFAK